ncbi:FliM/FliN family flagellar motor C-terminal domain-containing protein [Cribrihabitans sp. XS_ASV171]
MLARKLALARQDVAGGSVRSILRALRLGLARAADETLGLSVSVIGATQARRGHDELTKAIAEDRLYIFLAGPEERFGAVCLDLDCVASIIQQQTMGQLLDGPSEKRGFTPTDVAMVSPLIDAMFPRARELTETSEDRNSLEGYASYAQVLERRALLLALKADRYRIFDLTLEIAGGRRQGHATLVLPEVEQEALTEEVAELSEGSALADASGVIRAELDAVIARIRIPLAVLSKMDVGSCLELPGAKLANTSLVAIDKRTVARGRLGQCRGMRALRLNEKLPDPTEAEPLEEQFVELETEAERRSNRNRQPAADAAQKRINEEADPAECVEDQLALLSPEKAAAEISELAGLAGSD